VVCAPVYTIADVFADEHFAAREMITGLADPELGEVPAPGIVPKLSETPGGASEAGSWELGQANREVYGERLGLGDEELEQLREEGVI
jgi:crotonobetainyl-CoA:carnitine CoA-transferase CaiB-like acyl-CoA transferase